MNFPKLLSLTLIFAFFVIGCGKSSPEQIRDDVKSSVDANEQAKTEHEWETSGSNPEAVFKKWHESHAEPKDVCKVLLDLSPKTLTLFENEIKSPENADLVSPCKPQLVTTMEKYYDEQKKLMENSPASEAPKKSPVDPAVVPVPQPRPANPESAPAQTAAPSDKAPTTQVTLPENGPVPQPRPSTSEVTSPQVPSSPVAPTDIVAAATFRFPDNMQYRDLSKGYTAVRGDVGPKEIVLTFDDGPHPEYTDRILAALKAVNAKVIFFPIGQNSKAHPEVLRRSAAAGHSIGSHSVTHRCLAASALCAKSNGGKMLSFQEAVDEIEGGHQAVVNAIGWVDPFFRFPYGEFDPQLKNFLNERGVGQFFWNVDSEDWKNHTPQEVIDSTLSQIEKQGRGIVLFHDIQRKTAELLPFFLKELYYRGYSVVVLKSLNANDRAHSQLVQQ